MHNCLQQYNWAKWQYFLRLTQLHTSVRGNRVGIVGGKCNIIFLMNAYLMGSGVISHGEFYECFKQNQSPMKEISIVALCSASGGRMKSMSGLGTKQCSASNNPGAQMTFMRQRKLPHINSNQLRLSRRSMSIKKRSKV